MKIILEGKSISKSFGGVQAVSNVDFILKEGEMLGLIGPNGAGKTTLLNCISGVFSLTEGTMIYGDKIISKLKPHEIASMGIGRTYQIVRPFTGMTVLENVQMGAMFGKSRPGMSMKRAKETAEKAMEFVHLQDFANRYSTELTIAMRKRLELARALAMEPKVLLLDEVMAGLNAKEIESIMEVVTNLNQSGISIVMIEHVMKAVMGMCERIIVLQYGEKIADDTPEGIIRNEHVIKAYLGQRYMEATKHRAQ